MDAMAICRRNYSNKDGKTSVYYLARLRLADGKRVSKQFDRKIDAQAWEADQFSLLRKGQGGFDSNTKTLRELSDYWMLNYARKRKEGSSRIRDEVALKYQILPYFANKKLLDLQPIEVELWQQRLLTEQGLAPKTCNNCLGLFKKLLNDAIRWRYIALTRLHPSRLCR
jgi:Phage integrase, N-terminal SAM-like domain